MTKPVKSNGDLIKMFFETTQELKNSKIIRSDRFLGDIGEFIASKIFGVNLSKNQREKFTDGKINSQSVQIKFNCSPRKTNINVGNVKEYRILILILSKTSLHFPINCTSEFVVYNLSQDIVLKNFTITKDETYSCTKTILTKFQYIQIDYSDLNQ